MRKQLSWQSITLPTLGSSVRIRSFAQKPLSLSVPKDRAFLRRRTQVVRERFAKPSCTSSNLVDASNWAYAVYPKITLPTTCYSTPQGKLKSQSRDGRIGSHKGLKIPRHTQTITLINPQSHEGFFIFNHIQVYPYYGNYNYGNYP